MGKSGSREMPTASSGTGVLGMLRHIYIPPAEIEKRKMKLDIWKSVFVLAMAIFLAFPCYNALVNLHLQINPPLGVLILATILGVTSICATFVPVVTLRRLEHKSTMAISLVSMTVYCGAQFYPLYYTAVIVAVLMGLQSALFWTSAASYLTRIGEKFAYLSNEAREQCITRFFGVFFTMYQLSQVVTYTTIGEGFPLNTTILRVNGQVVGFCGAHFCAVNSTKAIHSGDTFSTSWTILTGVAFGLSLLAAFIVSKYLTNLPDLVGDWRGDAEDPPSVLRQITAIIRHIGEPYQLLLLFLTVWAGAEQAFLLYAFTLGFVSCSLGVHATCYVAITFACCSALTSSLSGYMFQHLGRRALFLSAAFLNLSMILLMLNWVPIKTHYPLFYIVAVVWGVADAVWHTQLSSKLVRRRYNTPY